MADTQAGWTKGFPKVDGVYWTRLAGDDTDLIPVRVEGEVVHEFGVNVAFREGDYANCEFLGPIAPPVGHKRETLQSLAEQIADSIRIGDQRKLHVANLLLAFAEEVTRQAVEP